MFQKYQLSISSKLIEYPVIIGNHLLKSFELIHSLKKLDSSLFVIITDSNVAPLHGVSLCKHLVKNSLPAAIIVIPAGEQFKTRETKEYCENRLLSLGAGRDCCIIGLGGGVVTDITGYVAATYCRGAPLILMPTTLLGMIDASIGGKNGINTPQGKNLLGTIYQPKSIFMDISTLQTLSDSEIKEGQSEMIKHALIRDKKYFESLKANCKITKALVTKSVQIKHDIVKQDEKELGIRRILNFGHTIGHAIEKASSYTITHGKAVAVGMLVESYLSRELGYLASESFEEIEKVLLPLVKGFSLIDFPSIDEIMEGMRFDKKAKRGNPRFVLLEGIGHVVEFAGEYCTEINEGNVRKALIWMESHVMCQHQAHG